MTAIVKAFERKPDQLVVDYVQSVLDNAKNGVTTGVLILEQKDDVCTWWCAGLGDRFKIIGYLMHSIHVMQDEKKT